ncbi:MAG: methyltransferase [Bacteroidetes bacterium]|nr:methyltransferase [Bacteroidota bacterium]
MKEDITLPKYPPVWFVKITDKFGICLLKIVKRMVPASYVVLEMVQNYWIAKSIGVAAELDIAESLKDSPKSIKKLAGITNTHPDSLYRLMRVLAGQGIFKEIHHKTFALTPMAMGLFNEERSMKYMVLHFLSPSSWSMFGEMLHTIKTGENAAQKIYGMQIFAYLKKDPVASEIYNKAMTNTSYMTCSAIVSAYSFAGINDLVDVGGGHGFLLSIILSKHKNMKGIVYDLPHVVNDAKFFFEKFNISDRAKIEAGDFLESVPSGGDGYLLKNIIHGWDDEQAIHILKNIREAMLDKGKLIMIETVIEENNEPSFGKTLDLLMLLGTAGGKERTRKEFENILNHSGFKLKKITKTVSPFCLIESVKA